MENASKALIIAGAILLSILIISLGIMVYNNAKSTVGEANLDSETAQTYNSKFIMYAGENVTADKVNSLIAAINSNNATNANIITVTASATTRTGNPSGNMYNYTFNNTTKYDVTYTLGATGLVSTMTIATHGASSTPSTPTNP